MTELADLLDEIVSTTLKKEDFKQSVIKAFGIPPELMSAMNTRTTRQEVMMRTRYVIPKDVEDD